jgi:hypothetical protein
VGHSRRRARENRRLGFAPRCRAAAELPLKPTGERRQAGEAEQLSRISERSALGLDVTMREFNACIIDDRRDRLAAQRQPAVQRSAVESQRAGKHVARASPGGKQGEYQRTYPSHRIR